MMEDPSLPSSQDLYYANYLQKENNERNFVTSDSSSSAASMNGTNSSFQNLHLMEDTIRDTIRTKNVVENNIKNVSFCSMNCDKWKNLNWIKIRYLFLLPKNQFFSIQQPYGNNKCLIITGIKFL